MNIIDKLGKKLIKEKKIKVRKVIKPKSAVLKISHSKPAEYVSRYFKDEVNEAKRSMFFE